jgi:hypothetical protein
MSARKAKLVHINVEDGHTCSIVPLEVIAIIVCFFWFLLQAVQRVDNHIIDETICWTFPHNR